MKLHLGDCLETLKTLPDASVDAVVTDPPYELGFMGKRWDASGIAYNVGLWTEALRVLKPGGHLLAFGGTRTYHRMACAIEDAGFEVRDSLHWIYGSGFPKSLNVAIAFDKAAGAIGHRGKRLDVAGNRRQGEAVEATSETRRHAPMTESAKAWNGWGTALKPAHEPVVVARKPLTGTVADNVQTHGTGALNIDGCRVGAFGGTAKGNPPKGKSNGVYGNGINGACDMVALNAGRWPPNLLLSHTPECVEVGTRTVPSSNPNPRRNSARAASAAKGADAAHETRGYGNADRTETIAAWECAEDCAVAEMDRQSGVSQSKAAARGGTSPNPMSWGTGRTDGSVVKGHTDSGGASRFFPVFRYQAKAPAKERMAAHDGTKHPTQKPVELMRWLVRLVTPPGGVVLDPFMGSGTTGVAAVLEGFDFIGIEREPEYHDIASARIEHTLGQRPKQMELTA